MAHHWIGLKLQPSKCPGSGHQQTLALPVPLGRRRCDFAGTRDEKHAALGAVALRPRSISSPAQEPRSREGEEEPRHYFLNTQGFGRAGSNRVCRLSDGNSFSSLFNHQARWVLRHLLCKRQITCIAGIDPAHDRVKLIQINALGVNISILFDC